MEGRAVRASNLRAQAERSMDLDSTIKLGYEEGSRLGIRFVDEFRASSDYSVNFMSVCDSEGLYICSGAGKGVGQQCEASALFEALEHFHLATATRYEQSEGRVFTPQALLEQKELARDYYLHRLAKDCGNARMACVQFAEIVGRGEIWYPAFFANPAFSERPLDGDTPEEYWEYAKYSTTTGSASGIELSDALLHGLLECIERDAVSLGLLSLGLGGGSKSVTVSRIDPRSLPADLAALYRRSTEASGNEPILLSIATDLHVPTFLAIDGGDDRIGRHGSGSSLSLHYAAERALGELIQINHITEWKELQPSRIDRGDIFDPWPLLKRIYEMDLPFDELPAVALGDDDHDPTASDKSSREQLEYIAGLLESAGLRAYERQWTGSVKKVRVVTVVVPGLERFICPVMLGAPAMPTGRGVEIMRDLGNAN